MINGEPVWIPAGTRFAAQDLIWFADRDRRSLDEALAEVDLIITGPHAAAAIPAELRRFVDDRFTARLQHDFTDISTSPIARRWAEIDPRVIYIEDPHPRAVRDANRPRAEDVEAALREAFDRLVRAGEHGRPSLVGVDGTRPVTFGYLPVLRHPTSESGWRELAGTIVEVASRGVDVYERVRDELIDRAVAAKCRRLVTLDPSTISAADWWSAGTLWVMSIHDTMNHTARPDGALCVEREPVDRLPSLVALSNRGDARGEARGGDGDLLDPADVPTLPPGELRTIADAYRHAFEVDDPGAVVLNHPYLGGYETQRAGPRLREMEPRTAVRHHDGAVRMLRLGAYQSEFLREFLLGPAATAHLMRPGVDWPETPSEHFDDVAQRLRAAHDRLRRWGSARGRASGYCSQP